MLKIKTIDDHIVLGITRKNVERIKDGDPLYFFGDDLKIDYDIQLVYGTKAVEVEGRDCFAISFTEAQMKKLTDGSYWKIEKRPGIKYSFLIFYGETEEVLNAMVNEATGGDRQVVPLKRTERYVEELVDGKVVKRVEDAAAIFRGGRARF